MVSGMEWLTEGPALMIGLPVAMYVLGLLVGAWGADQQNRVTRDYIKYLEQVNDELIAELDNIDNACYIKDRTSDAKQRKEKTDYGKSSKKESEGSGKK